MPCSVVDQVDGSSAILTSRRGGPGNAGPLAFGEFRRCANRRIEPTPAGRRWNWDRVVQLAEHLPRVHDLPLHEIRRGAVGDAIALSEVQDELLADGDIDGPDVLARARVLERDGVRLPRRADVGVGISREAVPAGRVTPWKDRSAREER